MLTHMAAAALGYAVGLLPSAEIVAKAAVGPSGSGPIDPRTAGSGNPGAANVTNLLGKKAGTAAVLGHCFPAHRNFRGGKGVAASFGQMLGTFPAYLPVDIALGAIAAKSDFWKQRPVATVGATCGLWTGLAALWVKRGLPNLWGPTPSISLPIAAAVSSAAIVYRFAAEADRPPTPPIEITEVSGLADEAASHG